MVTDEYITNGISMLQRHWGIIEEAASANSCGRSAQLRRIVQEWEQLRAMLLVAQAHITGLITTAAALERIEQITAEIPVPYQVTGE